MQEVRQRGHNKGAGLVEARYALGWLERKLGLAYAITDNLGLQHMASREPCS